jgi:hypothetical protein
MDKRYRAILFASYGMMARVRYVVLSSFSSEVLRFDGFSGFRFGLFGFSLGQMARNCPPGPDIPV